MSEGCLAWLLWQFHNITTRVLWKSRSVHINTDHLQVEAHIDTSASKSFHVAFRFQHVPKSSDSVVLVMFNSVHDHTNIFSYVSIIVTRYIKEPGNMENNYIITTVNIQMTTIIYNRARSAPDMCENIYCTESKLHVLQSPITRVVGLYFAVNWCRLLMEGGARTPVLEVYA